MTNETTTEPSVPVVVSGFEARNAAEWNDYVDRHPHGTIFHTLRWRDAINSVFHHPTRYAIARREGRITGILPLVEVSSLFFGTTLISVPFAVYGGLLVDDQATATSLIDHSRHVARERRAKYVELRHLHAPISGLPRNDLYSTFIADVPDTKEGCLARIPKKARAEVRKAIDRNELVAEIDRVSIPDLYRLFSINKRKLGSPIFPSSLFWHVKNKFGDDVSMLSVKRGDQLLCAVMSFIYKDTVMPYYSGSAPGAEEWSASNYMYFKLMEWASERKLRRFDFGRSRAGTGAFSFKKNQGFEPTQLCYDYVLNTAREMPSLNPSNPKFNIAKRVFTSLPLWMAQKVGSWVVKRAPF